ncbi:hypothetical protein [Bradyrhizobium vignae]|uniref:hypothetical protein n=1 Tax=Bradyrhizobium vignae TaxID=1549949 RepID=UPI00100AA0F6|nr:hypothetical protein [Bradyrhizobium vignae]RXG85616.1 hypothetical protein EAV90_34910 [Bradyrhizobium vignae]
MLDKQTDFVARLVTAKIERIKAGTERAQEQLQRSYRQLALSEKVLQIPTPKVWHPESPDDG